MQQLFFATLCFQAAITLQGESLINRISFDSLMKVFLEFTVALGKEFEDWSLD